MGAAVRLEKPMFSPEAESAYLALQSKAMVARDNYELERIDRALDEISRNPLNSRPAPFQYRSAMAHAGQAIEDRRRIVLLIPAFDGLRIEPGAVEAGYGEIEDSLWVEAMPLKARDRAVLHTLVADVSVEELAPVHGLTVQRMREAISRVRARARNRRASMETA